MKFAPPHSALRPFKVGDKVDVLNPYRSIIGEKYIK